MKKEKKNKKPDIKDSKKDSKKKSLSEEEKVGSVTRKEKSATISESQPDFAVDHAAVKKLLMDSAVLYQTILVLPQTFVVNGISYSLYPSELKALDMIGQFSGVNLTQLANKLDISKSAISKCTSKLLEKELVAKEKSAVNVREVVFTLTPNGQYIFDQLSRVNADLFEPFNKSFEGFSPQEINDLNRMFLAIQSSLTEIVNRV